MRRIIARRALLFINHGTTPDERARNISMMASPMVKVKDIRENIMRVYVERNVETDVPEWCATTDTWKFAKADRQLIELVRDEPEEEQPEEEQPEIESVSTPKGRGRKPLAAAEVGSDAGLNA